MGPCEEMIRALVGVRKTCGKPNGWRYWGPDDFIERHGRQYEEISPIMIKIGMMKACYANALNQINYAGHTYVEGYALAKGLIPIPHAWIIDDKNRVIEPTWKEPGEDYFGVSFKTSYVLSEILRSETHGIFWENECGVNAYLMKITEGELRNIIEKGGI